MNSTDTIKELKSFDIPEGFHLIDDWDFIQEGDKVLHFAGKITWIPPSKDEIGKNKKYAGKYVIRRNF